MVSQRCWRGRLPQCVNWSRHCSLPLLPASAACSLLPAPCSLLAAHCLLLDACCSLLAASCSPRFCQVDEAYFLLEQRKQDGQPVPLPAVNMIIEACAVMQDLDRAFATWAELETLDLQPNTGTYNALLYTCIRTREIASGRRLLLRLEQDGLTADSTTYGHQCSLMIMGGERDQALKLPEVVREAGLTVSAKMYASLINMCMRNGKHERAQQLLEQMDADKHFISQGLRGRVAGNRSA